MEKEGAARTTAHRKKNSHPQQGIIPCMECLTCHNALPSDAAFCPRCGARCADAPEPTGFRYAAFISYRHIPRDAQVAKQVQRAIETFRLPRHISRETLTDQDATRGDDEAADPARLSNAGNTANTTAPWPKPGAPLGKCFRDQDELAATHSLPQSIRDALAQSHALVVVCSPEANESAWVQREIEMFAQFHGRERIFCVLADGSSSESIPPLLKSKLTADTSGVMREMPASPLAADLRPKSPQPQKAELLRTIAAVAGLNYDDLKQRQRARKHRRIAAALGSAAAIVALIGALAFQSYSAHQTALIEESKSLAAQALSLFAEGDRRQAIETALRALPASESDDSRPLVPEAQAALEKVLAANPDPNQRWVPLYSVDMEDEIIDWALSGDNRWVALLDKSGTVSVFNDHTGEELTTVKPEAFADQTLSDPRLDWFIEPFGPVGLLMANRRGSGDLSAMAPPDADTLKSFEDMYALCTAASGSDGASCIFQRMEDGLYAWRIGLEDESACLVARDFSGFWYPNQALIMKDILLQDSQPQILPPDLSGFYARCLNDDSSAAYAFMGSTFYSFDFESGQTSSISFAGQTMTSMIWLDDDLFYTATDQSEKNDAASLPFSIGAVHADPTPDKQLWTHEDTYQFTYMHRNGNLYSAINPPRICDVIKEPGEHLLLIAAGSTILAVDANTGEATYQHTFGSSIENAAFCFVEEDQWAYVVVLNDGTIDILSPMYSVTTISDQSAFATPYIVDFADIRFSRGTGNPIAFIHAADRPNRIVCYQFLPTYENTEFVEYTLDELIEMGNSFLGRA